jgi:hypothetical protein
MRRVFNLAVLAGPRCGGRLQVIATPQDPLAVQAILAHRGRSDAPAPPGPACPGRDRLDFPLGQTLEASLSPPPCARALTARPRRRRC